VRKGKGKKKVIKIREKRGNYNKEEKEG